MIKNIKLSPCSIADKESDKIYMACEYIHPLDSNPSYYIGLYFECEEWIDTQESFMESHSDGLAIFRELTEIEYSELTD